MVSDTPASPSPTAGVPHELMADGHLRTGQQLAILRCLSARRTPGMIQRDVRTSARSALAFVDGTAAELRRDEETELFPELIESMAGSDAVCLRELALSLTAEHRGLESRWQGLRELLAVLDHGLQQFPLDAPSVDGFIDRYRRHIERDNAELLSMAARLLSESELARISSAMRRRRAGARQPGGGRP